ncbi:MAG: transcription elongation factor GreA [Fibrobacter sp.]|nr:transcription elongation factor GreA [Fibrobacter sp.]
MKHAISKEGFEKYKAEWEHLKYVERPAMINQVQAAAAEGDRSENAAYTYGRMRVREIDRRLRELDRIIDGANIVEISAPEDGSIRFGATVKLLDKKTKREKTYSIVGEKEIDPLQGRISLKSPIGEALVGKKKGETVQVQAPRGTITYEILDVTYN